MRYVSYWPSLTPLLFLAVYLPKRCRSTFAVPWRSGVRDLRCTKRAGHDGVHTHSYFRRRGTRLAGGFRKLSAYTRAKVLGIRTPATDTSADSNSCSQRGAAPEVFSVPTSYRRANSSFAHTLFTDETATRGANGQRLESVD